jgi:hypothetical protein
MAINKAGLTPDDGMYSLFHVDPVVSEQYRATFRPNAHLEPEKELMMAVLQDAIVCLQKHSRSSDIKGKRLFSTTRNWIVSENEDWLFSFNNVCEALGLAPRFVRRAILRMEEEGPHPVEESPRIRPRSARTRRRVKHLRPAV